MISPDSSGSLTGDARQYLIWHNCGGVDAAQRQATAKRKSKSTSCAEIILPNGLPSGKSAAATTAPKAAAAAPTPKNNDNDNDDNNKNNNNYSMTPTTTTTTTATAKTKHTNDNNDNDANNTVRAANNSDRDAADDDDMDRAAGRSDNNNCRDNLISERFSKRLASVLDRGWRDRAR